MLLVTNRSESKVRSRDIRECDQTRLCLMEGMQYTALGTTCYDRNQRRVNRHDCCCIAHVYCQIDLLTPDCGKEE